MPGAVAALAASGSPAAIGLPLRQPITPHPQAIPTVTFHSGAVVTPCRTEAAPPAQDAFGTRLQRGAETHGRSAPPSVAQYRPARTPDATRDTALRIVLRVLPRRAGVSGHHGRMRPDGGSGLPQPGLAVPGRPLRQHPAIGEQVLQPGREGVRAGAAGRNGPPGATPDAVTSSARAIDRAGRRRFRCSVRRSLCQGRHPHDWPLERRTAMRLEERGVAERQAPPASLIPIPIVPELACGGPSP